MSESVGPYLEIIEVTARSLGSVPRTRMVAMLCALGLGDLEAEAVVNLGVELGRVEVDPADGALLRAKATKAARKA